MVRRREICRLCDAGHLEQVLSLPPTPPANAFVKTPAPQEVFPQDLFRCRACGHVQLGAVVDAEVLFGDYVYASGTSPVFVRHFQSYADEVTRRFGLGAGDRVVEIGSNDGVLLRAFREKGLDVLGIDPARKIAAAATASGVETWPDFFTEATARQVVGKYGPAALVAANNCMAHIDDLAGVVRGVHAVLAPGGIFVMEVQYVVDMVRNGLWDMIYAEHVSYHAVGPLIPFFKRHGLGVFDVVPVPTHGGSIRVFVRAEPPFLERPEWDLKEEAWTSAVAFKRLRSRIDAASQRLRALLGDYKKGKAVIAGYGVPAKTTTLMYTMGLSSASIDYLVDDSPLKIGLRSPGLHIPVLAPSALLERPPQAVVIFAWNFAESIAKKIRDLFAARGLKAPDLIVPLPDPTVI
ncbi:MAG: class I SAM-dependent methyltransferase [Candidatus Coatesbacteria bacterium]